MLAAPNLSPAAICAAVAELHLGSAPFVDGTFQGGECRIFKVRFSDTPTTVAVRVRHPEHGDRQDIAISQVGDEARMLQRLEALGFRWSPRCRAGAVGGDPAVLGDVYRRAPYVVELGGQLNRNKTDFGPRIYNGHGLF